MTLDEPGIRHQRRSLRRCLGETRTAPTPRPQRGQPHVDGPLGGPSQYHGLWPWLIISLASQEDLRVAEKTLSLLPKDIPVAKFEVGGGVPGCLQAVALSIHITGQAGKARGIDPGRPSVPAFGRKLYHLNGAYRGKGPTRLPEREVAAIIRKAGIGIATLTAQGNLASWRESYSAFMDELRSAGFRAIVLDYDGTLCDAHQRYSGRCPEIT